MIKVIVFDFAEVIANGPLSYWVNNNMPIDSKEFLAWRNNSHLWDIGQMTIEQVYEYIGRITGIPANEVWDKFYAVTPVKGDVVDIIKKLKSHNYKLLLFSNFISEQLKKLLKIYGIYDLFDELIISSDYKMLKPDPNFIKLMIDKAGVKREEIVFIDDKLYNIDAAKKLKVNAIQFLNANQLTTELIKLNISL